MLFSLLILDCPLHMGRRFLSDLVGPEYDTNGTRRGLRSGSPDGSPFNRHDFNSCGQKLPKQCLEIIIILIFEGSTQLVNLSILE